MANAWPHCHMPDRLKDVTTKDMMLSNKVLGVLATQKWGVLTKILCHGAKTAKEAMDLRHGNGFQLAKIVVAITHVRLLAACFKEKEDIWRPRRSFPCIWTLLPDNTDDFFNEACDKEEFKSMAKAGMLEQCIQETSAALKAKAMELGVTPEHWDLMKDFFKNKGEDFETRLCNVCMDDSMWACAKDPDFIKRCGDKIMKAMTPNSNTTILEGKAENEEQLVVARQASVRTHDWLQVACCRGGESHVAWWRSTVACAHTHGGTILISHVMNEPGVHDVDERGIARAVRSARNCTGDLECAECTGGRAKLCGSETSNDHVRIATSVSGIFKTQMKIISKLHLQLSSQFSIFTS